MFKIISKKTYNKLVDEILELGGELATLKKQNADREEALRISKAEFSVMRNRIDRLKAECQETHSEKLEVLGNYNLLQDKHGKVELEFENYKKRAEERISDYRMDGDTKRQRIEADKVRIEELETELKIVKGKSNDLTKQSLNDKETIQNLKNDIALMKEEIAGKKNKIADLEEKIKAVKPTPVPTPPTTPTNEEITQSKLKEGCLVRINNSKEEYLTAGKVYTAIDGTNTGVLRIIDDIGDFIADTFPQSTHSLGDTWEIVEIKGIPNRLEGVKVLAAITSNKIEGEEQEIVLKDGMWVVAPEGCADYITPGKAYQVSDVFKSKYGAITFALKSISIGCAVLEKCLHLNRQDWIIVPAPEQVPNTLKDVELGAVAPLEAELVPTNDGLEVVVTKKAQPGPSFPQTEIVPEVREQLSQKSNVVGNVKRPYRKSGKFKKRK